MPVEGETRLWRKAELLGEGVSRDVHLSHHNLILQHHHTDRYLSVSCLLQPTGLHQVQVVNLADKLQELSIA